MVSVIVCADAAEMGATSAGFSVALGRSKPMSAVNSDPCPRRQHKVKVNNTDLALMFHIKSTTVITYGTPEVHPELFDVY